VNILFIHQNFPGQFIHLAANFAQVQKNKVVALTIDQHPVPPGVIVRPYTLLREPVERTHFLLRDQEAKILRAEACAAAALQLKREGFTPDIIVAHPGWGEALFIKDVFPTSKLVIYCEYYYAAEGQDLIPNNWHLHSRSAANYDSRIQPTSLAWRLLMLRSRQPNGKRVLIHCGHSIKLP
jgi:hypothetical protein